MTAKRKLQRKISICSESQVPEEQKLSYLEIGSVPPLPLFALFAADDDGFGAEADDLKGSSGNEKNIEAMAKAGGGEEALFGARGKATDTLQLDDLQMGFEMEDEDAQSRKKALEEQARHRAKMDFKKSLLSEVCSADLAAHFDSRVCRQLIEYLAYVQLDGITALDQIHLIALADTAANIRCDVTFSGRQDMFGKRNKFLTSQQSVDAVNATATASATVSATGITSSNAAAQPTVDTCGFKFLLALRSYNYLLRTLPVHDSQLLKKAGLGSAVFTWAFHSECQQELLAAITQPNGSNIALGKLVSKTRVR